MTQPTRPHNAVVPALGCPHCGEQDADRLIWTDLDRPAAIRCSTCGQHYAPILETPADDEHPQTHG